MGKANSFRINLQELGGAFGDLGTLLPLSVALITLNHMNATSVFLVVGIAYILAGIFYRLPIPVQPLKVVATIAIAGGLSSSMVTASALVMAVILLLLAWTGAVALVAKLFPKAIVRGVQLGVGLLLLKTGLVLINRNHVQIGGVGGYVLPTGAFIPRGWLIALALGVILALFLRFKKVPASMALLVVGGLAAIFWGSFGGLPSLHFGLSLPALALPALSDLTKALVLLVIPQIPLTLGNAVFATRDTARVYFGAQANRVTPKALLTTMGLTNLAAAFLGGMPICHGSGGLTAHFRLGARTGIAGLLIGVPLVLLAVSLDGSVLPVLSLIPYAALGVLLIYVAGQHCLLVRDLRGKSEVMVALAVAIPGLLTDNLTIGLAAGISMHLILKSLSRIHNLFQLPPGSEVEEPTSDNDS